MTPSVARFMRGLYSACPRASPFGLGIASDSALADYSGVTIPIGGAPRRLLGRPGTEERQTGRSSKGSGLSPEPGPVIAATRLLSGCLIR
jgi:hypothetical protein